MIFINLTRYREERVCRTIVYSASGLSTGSGFFISKDNFLTCFHVIFGGELSRLRNDSRFKDSAGADEHSKFLSFYNANINKVEIELFDGTRISAILKDFDEKYDIALLEVMPNEKIKICKVEWRPRLNRGDYVFFGGFPSHHSYSPDKTPIAVQEGMISSFIETQIGGEKYKHLQINSINLGGNSGAPLFKKGSKKVVGIINGNMNWGNDNVMIKDPINGQSNPAVFRIPLAIAYATAMDILKEKTVLFN